MLKQCLHHHPKAHNTFFPNIFPSLVLENPMHQLYGGWKPNRDAVPLSPIFSHPGGASVGPRLSRCCASAVSLVTLPAFPASGHTPGRFFLAHLAVLEPFTLPLPPRWLWAASWPRGQSHLSRGCGSQTPCFVSRAVLTASSWRPRLMMGWGSPGPPRHSLRETAAALPAGVGALVLVSPGLTTDSSEFPPVLLWPHRIHAPPPRCTPTWRVARADTRRQEAVTSSVGVVALTLRFPWLPSPSRRRGPPWRSPQGDCGPSPPAPPRLGFLRMAAAASSTGRPAQTRRCCLPLHPRTLDLRNRDLEDAPRKVMKRHLRTSEVWEILGSCTWPEIVLQKMMDLGIRRSKRWGFPGGSDGEESVCEAGDRGSIAGLGRSPGEGKGNPFQNCCLKSCMVPGAWRAAVRGVTEPDTTEWLRHTLLGHWVHYLLCFQETGIDQLLYLAPKCRSSCWKWDSVA